MEKLKEWRGTIETIVLAAIAGLVFTYMRPETWDRIERLAGKIYEDPAAAALAIGTVLAAIRGAVALWKRDPNTSPATSSSPRSSATGREGFAALDLLLLVLAGAGVLLAGLTLHGCGGAPRAAHFVVEHTGHALVAVDEVTAREYSTKAAAALEASSTAAEYSAAMAPMNHVEEALRTARSLLLASEHVVDTWDAGGSEQWLAAASCLAAALAEVVDALRAADVEIPPALAEAVTLASSFAGACPSSSSTTLTGGV
jgi:hypothetical protein